MTGFFMLVYKLKAKLELVYALRFKLKAKNNIILKPCIFCLYD